MNKHKQGLRLGRGEVFGEGEVRSYQRNKTHIAAWRAKNQECLRRVNAKAANKYYHMNRKLIAGKRATKTAFQALCDAFDAFI